MATRKASVKRKATRVLNRAETPVQAEEIIEELRKEIAPKAEAHPGENVPGITYGGTKKGYSYQNLLEMFPVVTFTPERTVGLTFQGVRVQAIGGTEMHVPSCFKKIYDESRRRQMEAQGLTIDRGYITTVALGAGALPDEK